MSDVIVLKGDITYPLTIDPSVWIFDERKIDLHTYTGESENAEGKTLEYLKGTGAQWDKEMAEGAEPPSERRSMIKQRKALEGDYAMPLAPFIENAKPLPGATHIRIHRHEKESIVIKIDDAKRAILQFSKDGKPLKEDGPVFFYLPEMWRAKEQPIDRIYSLEFFTE